MVNYIKANNIAIDDQDRLGKTGHVVYKTTAEHYISEGKSHKPLNVPLKSKDIFYKLNKHDSPFYSELEATFSEICLLLMSPKYTAPCHLVRNHNNIVTGVASEQISFHDYAKHKVEVAKTDLRSLAAILVGIYVCEDDDAHGRNIGTKDDGKTWVNIDHDLKWYNDVISNLENGARFNHLFSTNRWRITANDIRNFPDLEDAKPHYWPASWAFWVSEQNKYSDEDRQQFRAIAEADEFKKFKFLYLLKFALVSKEMLRESISRHVAPDSNIMLDMMRIFSARQAELIAVLLPMPEFRAFLAKDYTKIQQYKAMLQAEFDQYCALDPSMNRAPFNISKKFDEIVATAKDMDDQDTELHGQLRAGIFRADETLHKFGKHITKKNSKGETVLHLAAQLGNLKATKGLLRHKDKKGRTVAIDARTTDSPRRSAAQMAGFNGHLDVLEHLLNRGAVLSYDDVRELIHHSLGESYYDVVIYLSKKFPDAVNEDLKQKINQYIIQRDHANAVIDCAEHNRPVTCHWLLQNKNIDLDQTEQQTIYNSIIDIAATNSDRLAMLWLFEDYNRFSNINITRKEAEPSAKVVYNALETYLRITNINTQPETHRAFEFIDANNITEVIAHSLRHAGESGSFRLLLALSKHRFDHDTKVIQRELVAAAKSALKLIHEASLTAKEQKYAAIRVFKAVLPHVDDIYYIQQLASILENNDFNYISSFRNRLFALKQIFGSHGNTTTKKTIIDLLDQRGKALSAKDEAVGFFTKHLKKKCRKTFTGRFSHIRTKAKLAEDDQTTKLAESIESESSDTWSVEDGEFEESTASMQDVFSESSSCSR